MCEAEPVLVDLRPAGEVVPGMTANTILTSGAPLEWGEYAGGQRRALISGVIYEGLAADEAEAIRRLDAGEIEVSTLPRARLHRVGGRDLHRLDARLRRREPAARQHRVLQLLRGRVAPAAQLRRATTTRSPPGCASSNGRCAPILGAAVRRAGGVPLKPLMARAVRMGDELHSRNTAATTLLIKELVPQFVDLAADGAFDGEALRSTRGLPVASPTTRSCGCRWRRRRRPRTRRTASSTRA